MNNGLIHRSIRFHYSLRTLAIVVTLICFYFGFAREATKRQASRERVDGLASEYYWPFVLQRDRMEDAKWVPEWKQWTSSGVRREYFFWFFGFEYKLPQYRMLTNNQIVEEKVSY